MSLDLPPPATGKFFQPAADRVKGLSDRHVEILRRPIHNQLRAGRGEVDPNIIRLPLPLMPVRGIYDNATSHDWIIISTELRSFFSNILLDCF